MRKVLRVTAALAACALLLCAAVPGLGENAGDSPPQLDKNFTERDLSGTWDASADPIFLLGDTAESPSHMVSIEGGVITILDGGTYVLSGTLDDGTVVIDVKDDERVQLVLNGASITSASSAAIRVIQADKVFITLADGTENTLANGGSFDESSDVDAAVWSDEDLTFNGTGTLTVLSPAGNGIEGKDDVKFASGTYFITAGNCGVNANDSIRIAGGTFTVVSGSDAFRASHDSRDDLGYIYIWDGTFTVTAGGGAENGKSTASDFGFPAADGGFGDFTAGGEMPEIPEGFDPSGAENVPSPPDLTGDTGGMAPPDFSGDTGSITPPDFSGNTGGMMPPDFSEAAETSDESVEGKGFKASGDLVILGGEFTLDTASDAFHADGDLTVYGGNLTVASGDDGLHADGILSVLDGTVRITRSAEGLEAEVILISGGTVSVVSSDDGLNARSSTGAKETFDAQEGVEIRITGGTLTVSAEGDGIDSNGDLTITGGTVTISGPTMNMNGAIDYNGTAVISGGTLIAACASGMAENLSEGSSQPAFLVSLAGEAGEITVTDSAGDTVFTGTVEKSFGVLVVSCPELAVGETYTVTAGESSAEITLTDIITGSDAGGFAAPAQGGQEDSDDGNTDDVQAL